MKDKTALKWIVKRSKIIITPLIFLIILSSIISIVTVSFALTSKEVIDAATGQKNANLIDSCIRLALLIFVQLGLSVLMSNINVRVQGKLEIEVKQNLFWKLLKKDYRSISFHTGELLNRLTSDVGIVSNAVVNIIPSFFAMAVSVVASFYYLFKLDWMLAVIIVAIGPFVLIFARIYSKKMKALHKKCQESDGVTRSFIQEILQNIIVVKAFCNEEKAANTAANLQGINYGLKIRRNTINIYANIGLYLVFTFGYYFSLAWGAVKLSNGLITFGTLTAILQLVFQVQMPFKGVSGLLPQAFTSIASAERMMELENLPTEHIKAIDSSKNIYSKMSAMVIEDLVFKYDNESDYIFNSTSFKINKGDFVAIAGTSGIGKSTLLRIMLGLMKPTDGKMYFECEDKSIAINASTRNMFGYVPQGNMIFSGSIKDNICFFKKDISDDEVLRCAKLAQLEDLLCDLPNGISTLLKEGGEGLSEGQIQRIAIARALVYDAPILLLDEATSALDEKTERAVLDAIRSLNEKTCIIVSHKKAAFDICDKVIQIKDGKIEII